MRRPSASIVTLALVAIALTTSRAQDPTNLPIPAIVVTPSAADSSVGNISDESVADTTTLGLPPIPTQIESQIGPVRVVKIKNLACGGVRALGCFVHARHVIYIRWGMPRNVEWQTLEHEKFHVILWVSGNTGVLTEAQEDRFADAIGGARVQEMLHNLKHPK
jgi:hypothetical protein